MSSKTSHTLGVQLTSRNCLTLEELELYELCQLAGVVMEPPTFKIILDLLKMNVSPQAVLQMLKTMCAGKKKQYARTAEHSAGGAYNDSENMAPPRQRLPPKVRNTSGSSTSSRRAEVKK